MGHRKKQHANIESVIDKVLEDHKQLWYCFSEIAFATGLQLTHIWRVINESDKFVVARDRNHQPFVTTRKRFRKEIPFFRKLIGAFKNRIL